MLHVVVYYTYIVTKAQVNLDCSIKGNKMSCWR